MNKKWPLQNISCVLHQKFPTSITSSIVRFYTNQDNFVAVFSKISSVIAKVMNKKCVTKAILNTKS